MRSRLYYIRLALRYRRQSQMKIALRLATESKTYDYSNERLTDLYNNYCRYHLPYSLGRWEDNLKLIEKYRADIAGGAK
jgi:hypothetical protein